MIGSSDESSQDHSKFEASFVRELCSSFIVALPKLTHQMVTDWVTDSLSQGAASFVWRMRPETRSWFFAHVRVMTIVVQPCLWYSQSESGKDSMGA